MKRNVREKFKDCDLCELPFHYGFGRYELKRSEKLNMFFCDICAGGNWDGIVPEGHEQFMKRVAELGFDTSLNKKGWFDLY